LSLERRLARLEAQQPRAETPPRFLAVRSPHSWLPHGIARLTPMQSRIFLDPSRFRAIVAGRRSGKSYLAIAELIRAARSGPNRLCWYIAPSYRQAKQILWGPLKSAIPPQWIAQKSEVDLSLTLKGYGSTIALRSADNRDALRGSGLDFCVLDEFSSMDPETWHEVIRPALADKRGHAVIQGSPRGYNALFDLYMAARETPTWAAFKFSTAEGGLVRPEEIDAVKGTLDPRTFAQEFEASFEQSTNRCYMMFSREHNVRDDLHDTGGPLLIGIDFNVSPMSAVIGQKAGDQLHIFDEVSLHNSNTQGLVTELMRRYPPMYRASMPHMDLSPRVMLAFPDPSGNSRKTSAPAGQTDFSILRLAGLEVIAPLSAAPVVDRINTVNAMLCNAKGQRRLFVHERCTRLIEGLERQSYRADSNQPDKTHGFDHITDSLGYLIMSEFPITEPMTFVKLSGV
jgi:hypothetical protein